MQPAQLLLCLAGLFFFIMQHHIASEYKVVKRKHALRRMQPPSYRGAVRRQHRLLAPEPMDAGGEIRAQVASVAVGVDDLEEPGGVPVEENGPHRKLVELGGLREGVHLVVVVGPRRERRQRFGLFEMNRVLEPVRPKVDVRLCDCLLPRCVAFERVDRSQQARELFGVHGHAAGF